MAFIWAKYWRVLVAAATEVMFSPPLVLLCDWMVYWCAGLHTNFCKDSHKAGWRISAMVA